MQRLVSVVLLSTAAVLAILTAAGAAPTERAEGPLAARSASAVVTNMLSRVLPAYDNRPNEARAIVDEAGRVWAFYVAVKDGRYAGAAFESSSDGYNGPIRVLVGVNSTGSVQAIEIIEQKETKGLGSRVTEPGFRSQFVGKNIVKTKWRSKARGGDIDAVTGATVSSDAVAAAVKSGLNVYVKHLDVIRRVVESGAPAVDMDANNRR